MQNSQQGYQINSSVRSFTVFVGGIPGGITKKEISLYFSNFGRVTHVKIPENLECSHRNKGFCYVSFEREESMRAAIQIGCHFLGSRKVSCKEFQNKDELSKGKNSRNDSKIFVKFIPSWMTESHFKQYFRQFGELETCYTVKFIDQSQPIVNNLGSFGYLIFKDDKVRKYVLSRKFFKVGSTKMKVQPYVSQESLKTLNPSLQNNLEEESEKLPKNPLETQFETPHWVKPTQRSYRNSSFKLGSVRNTIEEAEVIGNLRFNCRRRIPPSSGSLSLVSVNQHLNSAVPLFAIMRPKKDSTEKHPTMTSVSKLSLTTLRQTR